MEINKKDFEKAFRDEHAIYNKAGMIVGSRVDSWDSKKVAFYRNVFLNGSIQKRIEVNCFYGNK